MADEDSPGEAGAAIPEEEVVKLIRSQEK